MAELPPVALYVHVPFCVSICPYCDFVVVAGRAARGPGNAVHRFVGAVLAELELRADALDSRFGLARLPLASVYLGGGTPTMLPGSAIERLLDTIRARFGLAPGAEIAIEANPGSDERGDLAGLGATGITRLSIGAQSLDDSELRRIGRRHAAADVIATVDAARRAGIASVGLDLLYDLPEQSLDRWQATLERAIAIEPDHLSLYALSLDDPAAEGLTGPAGDHLPVRSGATAWRAKARDGQDEDRAADMYEHATRRLRAEGYRGYEISNWARPGHESRHNLAYWRRQPHEAVGPGAHAFDGRTRRWNAASLPLYLDALAPVDGSTARLPLGGAEVVDDAAAATERAILGLRLEEGLTADLARARPLAPHLAWAVEGGLLEERNDGRARLTTRGRLLSNELFARLV